ncbi:MAG: beta-glucosidase [Lachnospiraceae bacterium]|nr:beta-glucosidase [Lachnospiraceae bacterium]
MGFKKDFVWGAATASYQIEGAAFEGEKGLNVWDVCCMQPGFVKDGDTGNVACDHYHRFKEDVAIMKKMGLKAYRFSISWSRVLPEGVGKVNEEGLDFYDKLVDELVAAGIEPYVTLFHWDYPDALFRKGSWLNPDSPKWFAEYAKVIVDRLSDRVTHWMTINEPQCYINLGYGEGTHAPGLKLNRGYVLQAAHNTLLAHGMAVQVIRKYSKKPCEIGVALVGGIAIPETDTEADYNAARSYMFDIKSDNMMWSDAFWMDPIYLGKYPENAIKFNEKWWPKMGQDDLKIINQPLDFFGMNSYHDVTVRAGKDGGVEVVKKKPGYARTAMHWAVTPEILHYGPKFFYERYKLPILVTENGLSNTDTIFLDGKVHDNYRIDFLNKYLLEYKKAADEGVDLKGYLQWSFLDNFEWAEGYNERFGLVYVDYPTGERTMKDSAYWYADVIKTNGENL